MVGEIDSTYFNNDYRRNDTINYRRSDYRSGAQSGNADSTYMNSAFSTYRTKKTQLSEYDKRRNEIEIWIQKYGNFTQTEQNKAQGTGAKLTDDTKIPIDLGDGQTTEITYKDLNDNIITYIKGIEQREKELEKIKENTDENGNARITDDTPLSEMSFGQKAGKVGIGLLNGGFKFVKSFLGMEDGWKGFKNGGWKRCLANVGIAAGTLALMAIPGVGPVLGTAFLWLTRGDAIVNAGKGVYKMCTAETAGELEAGAEDIGVALVEVAGGKAASKRIRIKGGQKGGKLGLFKKFKAEWQATKTLVKDEKRAYQIVKNTSKDKGLFGKLLKFAKFKKHQNKKYCANKIAYEEQKGQMQSQINDRYLNVGNKVTNRSTANNPKDVVNQFLEEQEYELLKQRNKKMGLKTREEVASAINEQRKGIKELHEVSDKVQAGTSGNTQLETALQDADARAEFFKGLRKLRKSERQFNRQYRQLYRSRQKAIGAQLVRGINPDEVQNYTGKIRKFDQLWALNKKPQDMGWMRFLGKFGFKIFWDGAMLTYNGGKAIVGTPYEAMPLVRHWINPHELEGEFISKDDIVKLEQENEIYKNQLAQLEEIKTQAEKYYA